VQLQVVMLIGAVILLVNDLGCGGLVVEFPPIDHEDASSNLTGVGDLIMITIAKQCMGKTL
jgi:hypothetical protein